MLWWPAVAYEERGRMPMPETARQAGMGLTQERRPVTAADLAVAGVDIDKDCPGLSLADLRQYPVLSEGGWYIVIKNIVTLEDIARRPWRLLGPIELLSHHLVLD